MSTKSQTTRYKLWREVFFLDEDGTVELDHNEDEVIGVEWKGKVVRITYRREIA